MTSANIAIDIHQSMLFDDTEFYSAAIKKQIRLLNQSINSEKSLSYILNEKGMTYDDLVYINSNRPNLRDNHYFTIDDFKHDHHNVPVVSFFFWSRWT